MIREIEELETSENVISQARGFDIRVVDYEHIHNIRKSDFDALVSLINPQSGDRILDAGCGYGAVTREVCSRRPQEYINFVLCDISAVQLKRSRDTMKVIGRDGLKKFSFVQQDVRNLGFMDSASFDKVVAKMLIHELPGHLQLKVFSEFYRILKPGGKLIVWDLNLSADVQPFFQSVISKKDQLAGYDDLVSNRYFFNNQELNSMMSSSGFSFQERVDLNYELETVKRLSSEFGGDKCKLEEWNRYIKSAAPTLGEDYSEIVQFDLGKGNIKIEVSKAITSMVK